MKKHAQSVPLLFCLAGAALAAPPAANDELMDVTALKEKLRAYGDGKNHYLVMGPGGELDGPLFYGDGKTFWAQRVFGGGSGPDSFSRSFWEPRITTGRGATFERNERKYTVSCGKRVTEFQPLPEEEAKKIIDAAQYFKARWKHSAYALARDNTGKYFYVDRVREPEESKSFRLYAGPKGNLKLQKMTNVVSDSEGDIFATKTGSLRLVLNKAESMWQQGQAKQKLISLPVDDNRQLIYTDLGVYAGQPLGTPCDDLL